MALTPDPLSRTRVGEFWRGELRRRRPARRHTVYPRLLGKVQGWNAQPCQRVYSISNARKGPIMFEPLGGPARDLIQRLHAGADKAREGGAATMPIR